MKTIAFCLMLLAGVLVHQSARAQNYSIDWYKIAGGGGTSANGQYSLSGVIGQPDASSAMTGGSYAVTGGFWSLLQVAPSAGLPNLTLTHNGNTVTLSWPATGSYTLQQNPNLANPAGWSPATGLTVTACNGTSSVTISPPVGNLFFRLSSP
jgi:hypothetical protein